MSDILDTPNIWFLILGVNLIELESLTESSWYFFCIFFYK